MTGRLRRPLVLAAVLAVVFSGPTVVSHALCITGRAGWDIAGVELFVLPSLLAAPVGCIALLIALHPTPRRRALWVAASSAYILLLFVPTVWASTRLRSYGFSLAAHRAEPLVQAIQKFERDKGMPPQSLGDLVPGYLPQIPSGLPPIELLVGKEVPGLYFGNAWVLSAPVATGIINWDRFLFFPNQQYPEVGYGGWLESVAGWAYVHE